MRNWPKCNCFAADCAECLRDDGHADAGSDQPDDGMSFTRDLRDAWVIAGFPRQAHQVVKKPGSGGAVRQHKSERLQIGYRDCLTGAQWVIEGYGNDQTLSSDLLELELRAA